jgi:hypothetical protein
VLYDYAAVKDGELSVSTGAVRLCATAVSDARLTQLYRRPT